MKSFLGPMALKTCCLIEKWSPPMFQLMFTEPRISASSKRCTNCSVNFYTKQNDQKDTSRDQTNVNHFRVDCIWTKLRWGKNWNLDALHEGSRRGFLKSDGLGCVNGEVHVDGTFVFLCSHQTQTHIKLWLLSVLFLKHMSWSVLTTALCRLAMSQGSQEKTEPNFL